MPRALDIPEADVIDTGNYIRTPEYRDLLAKQREHNVTDGWGNGNDLFRALLRRQSQLRRRSRDVY